MEVPRLRFGKWMALVVLLAGAIAVLTPAPPAKADIWYPFCGKSIDWDRTKACVAAGLGAGTIMAPAGGAVGEKIGECYGGYAGGVAGAEGGPLGILAGSAAGSASGGKAGWLIGAGGAFCVGFCGGGVLHGPELRKEPGATNACPARSRSALPPLRKSPFLRPPRR